MWPQRSQGIMTGRSHFHASDHSSQAAAQNVPQNVPPRPVRSFAAVLNKALSGFAAPSLISGTVAWFLASSSSPSSSPSSTPSTEPPRPSVPSEQAAIWADARREIEVTTHQLRRAAEAEELAATSLARARFRGLRLARRKALLERRFLDAVRNTALAEGGAGLKASRDSGEKSRSDNRRKEGGDVDPRGAGGHRGAPTASLSEPMNAVNDAIHANSSGGAAEGGSEEEGAPCATPTANTVGDAALVDDGLGAYRRMLGVGVPPRAVAHKMAKDGVDPNRLNLGLGQEHRLGVAVAASDKGGGQDGGGGGGGVRALAQPSPLQDGAAAELTVATAHPRHSRLLQWEPIEGARLEALSEACGGRETIWRTKPGDRHCNDGTPEMAALAREVETLFFAAKPKAKAAMGESRRGSSGGMRAGRARSAPSTLLEPQRVLTGSIALARVFRGVGGLASPRPQSLDPDPAALVDAVRQCARSFSGRSPPARGSATGRRAATGVEVADTADAAAAAVVFDGEALDALSSLVPTRAEMLALARGPPAPRAEGGQKQPSSFSPLEETMRGLGALSHCASRLEAMRLRLTLADTCAALKADAATVAAASAAVRASAGLRRAVHAVLLVGNCLDQASSPAAAAVELGAEVGAKAATSAAVAAAETTPVEARPTTQAFTLRSLLALAKATAVDGQTTALSFLVTLLEQQEGSGCLETHNSSSSSANPLPPCRVASFPEEGLAFAVAAARRVPLEASERVARSLDASRARLAASMRLAELDHKNDEGEALSSPGPTPGPSALERLLAARLVKGRVVLPAAASEPCSALVPAGAPSAAPAPCACEFVNISSCEVPSPPLVVRDSCMPSCAWNAGDDVTSSDDEAGIGRPMSAAALTTLLRRAERDIEASLLNASLGSEEAAAEEAKERLVRPPSVPEALAAARPRVPGPPAPTPNALIPAAEVSTNPSKKTALFGDEVAGACASSGRFPGPNDGNGVRRDDDNADDDDDDDSSARRGDGPCAATSGLGRNGAGALAAYLEGEALTEVGGAVAALAGARAAFQALSEYLCLEEAPSTAAAAACSKPPASQSAETFEVLHQFFEAVAAARRALASKRAQEAREASRRAARKAPSAGDAQTRS